MCAVTQLSRPQTDRASVDQTCDTAGETLPTILCIDDDPQISTAIEMHLRPYAVHIERAYYGMQGIWESVQQQPDLIIMDVAMPNGDGIYSLECLRQRDATAHIPIIMLTGMRDPKLKARLLSAGADMFLQKPIHFDELLHQITRYITLRRRDEDLN